MTTPRTKARRVVETIEPPTASVAPTDADPVDGQDAALVRWLGEQRWFATPDPATARGGGRGVVGLLGIPLDTEPPIALTAVETADGHRYQLLLPSADTRPAKPSTRGARGLAGRPTADLGTDPAALGALAELVAATRTIGSPSAAAGTGHWLAEATPLGAAPARLLGAEQSNTSAVVGGTHVLKVFRRLQDGSHPEVEIGAHLADADAPVARLSGWLELEEAVDPIEGPASAGTATPRSTALAVVQELVPGALDGWELVLGGLAGDPDGLLHRLHDLGHAIAVLHGALARPAASTTGPADEPVDPEAPEAFGATPLGRSRISALVTALAADATRLLATSIDRPPELAPVVGRAEQVAVLARRLAGQVRDDLGAAIRHHGDLHLGQTVVGAEGWVILDFEGEPARPLAERRLRHSPLRDVAGMLRSLAYAVSTHQRAGGRRLSPGWEPAARAALLDGYLAAIDPALVPASAVATRRLLTLFELEKVVYEIGYEVAHRPDWVGLPVAGLRVLLDRDAADAAQGASGPDGAAGRPGASA